MVRKCSVGGCKSNYASQLPEQNEVITVFGFPSSKEERAKWLASLPNSIKTEKVTANFGVCAKHFPPDVPMVRKGRYFVPTVPPSIFVNAGITGKYFTQRLIGEVEKHRILYNSQEPGHKDRSKTDAVWQAVAGAIGCSADVAKRRWQSLKLTYCRSRSRRALSSGSPAEKETSSYLAEMMSFLDPDMQQEPTLSLSCSSEPQSSTESRVTVDMDHSQNGVAMPRTSLHTSSPENQTGSKVTIDMDYNQTCVYMARPVGSITSSHTPNPQHQTESEVRKRNLDLSHRHLDLPCTSTSSVTSTPSPEHQTESTMKIEVDDFGDPIGVDILNDSPSVTSSPSPPHQHQTEPEPHVLPSASPTRSRIETASSRAHGAEWPETDIKYPHQSKMSAASNPDLDALKGLLPQLGVLSTQRKRRFFQQAYDLAYRLVDEQEEEEEEEKDKDNTPPDSEGTDPIGSTVTPDPRPPQRVFLQPKRPTKRMLEEEEVLALARQTLTSPRPLNPIEEKFNTYGRSIAHRLRNLPREQRFHVEKIFADAIYAAQLGTLSKQSRLSVGASSRRKQANPTKC